jgi:CHAT domain-containing protein
MTSAERITDPELRARAVADAQFAAGVVAAHSDTRRARYLLGQAIDHYRTTGKSFYLPEALLARARASLQNGDRAAALADLEEGLAELDRHRALVSGNVTGTGVVEARRALLDELIPLRLDSGDTDDAFSAVEKIHDRLGSTGEHSTAPSLQSKLAGSDALVLELVVLPHEVIAFAVTAHDITVARRPAVREHVMELATRAEQETDLGASRDLYDLLIRPSQTAIAHAGQLIIVPDSALQNVPVAALENRATGRHLIETITVATAVAAGSLEPSRRRSAPPSIVALALPSGDGESVALPESDVEVAALAGLYRTARVIDREHASMPALTDTASADVIHLGGHTVRQPGAGDAALLFRGRDGGIERITWTLIASMKFDASVVVLAACETAARAAVVAGA